MGVDLTKLISVFPDLAKSPNLTMALASLTVPIAIIYGATKFSSASNQAFLLFCVLGICCLVFVRSVIKNVASNSKDQNS